MSQTTAKTIQWHEWSNETFALAEQQDKLVFNKKILDTQKSNISRLENANSTSSPKLSTIEQYARAVGYDVEIKFVPMGH